MYEATLRVAPGGQYGEPTEGTGATVRLWCNDHCDLLEVRGEGTDAVVAAIEDRVTLRGRVVRDGRTLAITGACLQEHGGTVERHMTRHGCLLLPPLRYARGAKFCRVLALDSADLTGLYRDLSAEREVTVESKRSLDEPSAERPAPALDAVLPTLSPRQREALTVAYEGGYYRIPREITTEDVADALGVQRRTAEEHLRRAENKLLDATIEHVGDVAAGAER